MTGVYQEEPGCWTDRPSAPIVRKITESNPQRRLYSAQINLPKGSSTIPFATPFVQKFGLTTSSRLDCVRDRNAVYEGCVITRGPAIGDTQIVVSWSAHREGEGISGEGTGRGQQPSCAD